MDKKHFSIPSTNYYNYTLEPILSKKNIKDNSDDSNGNTNYMYNSIIINKNTKKIGSALGESYLICNNDNDLSDLRKSEYDSIKKQDLFAKINNTKKYIDKGKNVITKGNNVVGALVILYSIGKYLLPFLV